MKNFARFSWVLISWETFSTFSRGINKSTTRHTSQANDLVNAEGHAREKPTLPCSQGRNMAFWYLSWACNIKKAAAFANWSAPKKGALFSLIYCFESFCIYYIPHNYFIPQTMPHANPQTHSSLHSPISNYWLASLWHNRLIPQFRVSSDLMGHT